MAVEYALFKNNLTSEPNDYAAHVQIGRSVDLDGLIQRMIDQGSTVTESDIQAVLLDAIKAIEAELLAGNRVNFGGIVDLYPRIKGVFNGPADTFDKSRHTLTTGATPGSQVRKTMRDDGGVEKVEAIKPAPSPIEISDLETGDINESITTDSIGTIIGHRLKYNTGAADEGIYLIRVDTGDVVKVDKIQRNMPSELIFLVPDLEDGDDYYVEVRARMGDGTELRVGRLDAIIVGNSS